MSEIAVIGAGYVGLTTAACLSHLGHRVTCGDVDADRIGRLAKGEIPILEDGLPSLVEQGLKSGHLRFVVGAAEAARAAEFVFLAVPTPQGENGAADLSIVRSVAREIAPVLRAGAVVINKSTMPVGSSFLVARELGQAGALKGIGVASNPEFLREGSAVRDFLEPHRVVIGCDDTDVAVRVSELYRALRAPILVTDSASAELIKYASNAFLATKISFINAIADLCELIDADVRDVALGMGYDPRIGSEFLQPGPGFGGSCFPKDTAALLHTAQEAGYGFDLLQGVIDINHNQRERVLDKIRSAAGGSVRGVTVGILGLTFKANTDDLRDSPSLAIAERLLEEGALLRAYDPAARETAVPGLVVVADAYEAAEGASVVGLLTEWDEFRWLDFERVAGAMSEPHGFVDARNLLDPSAMRQLGFAYRGIGR